MMKKLLSIITMAIVLFAVGCQQKSEPVKVNYNASELAGSYTGSNLQLSINGHSTKDYTVVVSGSDLSKMTFTISEDGKSLVYSNVVVTNTNEGCTFEDKLSYNGDNDMESILSGNIIEGHLNVVIFGKTLEDYTGSYDASKTSFTVAGNGFDLLDGQVIEFAQIEENKNNGTLTIPAGMIPGVSEPMTVRVALTHQEDNAAFEGVEGVYKVSGIVTFDYITVMVTPQYTNEMVGVWNFPSPVLVNGEDITLTSIVGFDAETPDNLAYYFGMETSVEMFNTAYSSLIGGILRLYADVTPEDDDETTSFVGALRNLNFAADGNFVADYNKAFNPMPSDYIYTPAQWVSSPKGAMKWYKKEDKIYLVPNLNVLTKAGLSSEGLPFEYRTITTDWGKTYTQLYVTKEKIAPIISLLNMVIQEIPDEANELIPMVKMMVTDMNMTAAKATKFTFFINLERGEM